MGTMPVVAVGPDGQFGGAWIGCVVGSRIGPLAQARLDEALGLSVIRYEIGGASFSGCSRKGADDMVSPSGTRGAGSTKVRAGRP